MLDKLTLRQRDERLRAMKALVGNLVHSFNNSLAPISGYIALLSDEVPPDTTGSQYLAKFSGCLRKAQGLIHAVQQATHPEPNCVPTLMDLGSVSQRTTERWMKALPDRAQISLAVEVIPCVLSLDETQWTQVIEHLLCNAEFALAGRGAIHLRLSREVLTPDKARALGMEATDACELLIEDSGCGMSEEVLNQACDPLFTTHARGPLSGLGLTYVHSVVRSHGGQLTIESVEGTGTRVTIWLPAAPPARG